MRTSSSCATVASLTKRANPDKPFCAQEIRIRHQQSILINYLV